MVFADWRAYALNGLLAALLVFLLLRAAVSAGQTRNPGKLQVFMELMVDSMANIFRGALGPGGEKHLPLPLTLFFYILFCNILGQVPGLKSATAATGTTFALSLLVFIYVQYVGIRSNGLVGYVKHFMGPQLVEVKRNPDVSPVKAIFGLVLAAFFAFLIAALFMPIELIGELVKPFSLAMRLWGNIYAEDLINDMCVAAGNGLHIPVQIPVYGLQLFTDVIQAFIFSILTCAYIALLSHHDEGEDNHDVDAHTLAPKGA